MANSGSGVIVYGVAEAQKAAISQDDIGEVDERHESSLHSAAITAVSSPVFGLKLHRLGQEGTRALAVVVPASVDGPHLIYRGEYFGAPIRNDADTVWMKERQIEATYFARFEERRFGSEALDGLYDDGSVTLATAIGGHRGSEGTLPGNRISSSSVEGAVADPMELLRVIADQHGGGDY